MPIAPNKHFDHYEILAPLGKGGMGEVFRARDTRLNRDVAIKVLPADFAYDADRLRRFELEARAVGALNHPNILTVHDFGLYEGNPYLVMELLEGEELRTKLQPGALPVRKAIDYAEQIANGLSAAHDKNVVHRDLKPANLFVTTDGRVKILDFGLAKLAQRQGEGARGRQGEEDVTLPLPHSPAPPLTIPGAVLGTIGYMSPEQVRGEVADHRSDIFSFGVILYEMLSGKRAFTGESHVEVLNAILKDDPPELSETNAKVAPVLDRIVRRCLEKKPERRFQSASDLGFALEAVTLSSGSQLSTAPVNTIPVPTSWMSREKILLAAASLFALLALGLAWAYFTRKPEDKAHVFKTSLLAPEKSSFRSFAVSPDGKWLAFTAATGGKVQLWVRALDSLEAKALAGTEGALNPFWSPDSRFIGFFASGNLKKIALSGGPPTTLCEAPQGRGGTWSRDGVILFTPNLTMGVHRVSADGGVVTAVTTPNSSRQENSHYWPNFLPDGRHFLYLVFGSQPEEIGIYLASLDGQGSKKLVSADSMAVCATSERGGYLFFVRAGTLLAQPFDVSERRLTGEPVRLADQVQVNDQSNEEPFSVSENGVLVYRTSGSSGNQQLGWFDRAGNPLGAIGSPGTNLIPALSPDEKRVAVSRLDLQTRNADIWLLDLSRGTESRLTSDPATDHTPVWSPDGSRIVWNSNREGPANLYQKATSGAGRDELLLKAENWKFATDWSRDGRFIIYGENNPKTKDDLWMLPLDEERKPFPYLQTPFNEVAACFSPDSKWIAYISDESGGSEVYVQAFPATGGKWRISTNGGHRPRWGRDGNELFYFAPDGKLMVVEVKHGATFEVGVPRVLFDLRGIWSVDSKFFVTGDGQRFLIVINLAETNATPLTLVQNWTAELHK